MAVKRLIETFVPENYKIFLDIDRKTKKIKGQVAITGKQKIVLLPFMPKVYTLVKFVLLVSTQTSLKMKKMKKSLLKLVKQGA